MPDSVRTGVTASIHYTQWEACIAAGLDPYLWDGGHYPKRLMAKTLAWYEGHELVEQHKQSALAEDMKRKAKRKGK